MSKKTIQERLFDTPEDCKEELSVRRLIKRIQNCLTQDLLKKEYREQNTHNPMFGHCYVATEVLYHLMQTKEKVKPCCAKDENNITHWWLQYKESGKIIDVTADQYLCEGKYPPYPNGRGTGFLTKKPSKRAQIVINRLSAKS